MTNILFIFMSDIYLLYLMRDVLLLLSTILYNLWVKLYEYLMRRCEKACHKAWPPVNIKTAIFNLQYKNLYKLDIYFLKYEISS